MGFFPETSKPVHLPARDASKDQNEHVQSCAPAPSSVSSEQEHTYTNSHPLVEDAPAEDLLAVRSALSGGFGARCFLLKPKKLEVEQTWAVPTAQQTKRE